MSLSRKETDTVTWTSVSLIIWGGSYLIRTVESTLKACVNRSSVSAGGYHCFSNFTLFLKSYSFKLYGNK